MGTDSFPRTLPLEQLNCFPYKLVILVQVSKPWERIPTHSLIGRERNWYKLIAHSIKTTYNRRKIISKKTSYYF